MSLVTRTMMLDVSANYELHVAFHEWRRIRIGSSSVVRYTIRRKIQEDVRKLASSVSELTLQLHEVQGEKNELESTLDRVIKQSCDVGSSSCSHPISELNIMHELQAIKARLSHLEGVVFCRR
ncbi:hypothetical protein LINPERHAP2_LOCUS16907 [Linum perenne]